MFGFGKTKAKRNFEKLLKEYSNVRLAFINEFKLKINLSGLVKAMELRGLGATDTEIICLLVAQHVALDIENLTQDSQKELAIMQFFVNNNSDINRFKHDIYHMFTELLSDRLKADQKTLAAKSLLDQTGREKWLKSA